MLDQLLKLDTNLFLWLNSHHSPFWDNVMWFISGRIEWLPLYLVLIAFIIYRFRWKSIPILIAAILTIALADQLAVKAFKEVFERLRPTHNPEIQHLVHIVNDYRGGSYGFVSNHAANSFSLAMFISLLFKNHYVTIGMLFWAFLVSYSRIYLGVHYPGDILGGIALGIGIGWFIIFIYRKFTERFMNGSSSSGISKVSE
ncbi:MAG: phosphatase PAP2 family protein [Bacteroidales bacterium]|nr:phosphatase PAP2 family protein [Bacteroidales bacterium]